MKKIIKRNKKAYKKLEEKNKILIEQIESLIAQNNKISGQDEEESRVDNSFVNFSYEDEQYETDITLLDKKKEISTCEIECRVFEFNKTAFSL